MKELKIIPQHKPFNILLIGDSCIDEYQYGNVKRISPEAPVPIFNYLYTEEKHGMVLNVFNNLKSFNLNVTLLTPKTVTKKIRLVDIKTKCHILRLDKDEICKEPLQFSNLSFDQYDAVVISDYEKGFITSNFIVEICKKFTCPIFLDTKKKDLSLFKNCYIKINELERNTCSSLCAEANLIVTMGELGAIYNNVLFPGIPVEVTDVCGAGDTFLASLVYFTLLTGSIECAIPYANRASSITVQHFGTYAPTLEEIYAT